MKRLKFLTLSTILSLSLLVLNSCGNEEEDPKPTVDFIGGDGFISTSTTVEVDSVFNIGINASAEKNIESVNLTVSYDGGVASTPNDCSFCDSAFKSENIRAEYTVKAKSTPGTETWTFTVADKDNNVTSKSITITVTEKADPGVALQEIDASDNGGETIKVYNFQGPNAGAFDLIINSGQKSTDFDEDKDIQDLTEIEDLGNPPGFPGSWGSKNGAMFYKVSGLSYNDITTDVELAAAFDNNTGAGSATINPVAGDLIIVQLGRSGTDKAGKLVLLNILTKEETTADNEDYIAFEYKKIKD